MKGFHGRVDNPSCLQMFAMVIKWQEGKTIGKWEINSKLKFTKTARDRLAEFFLYFLNKNN